MNIDTISNIFRTPLFLLLFSALNIPLLQLLHLSFFGSILLLLFSLSFIYLFCALKKTQPDYLKILLCVWILSGLILIGNIDSIAVPRIFAREFCLTYVGQGTLYSDSPYCVQGPTMYILGYFLSLLPLDLDLSTTLFSLFTVFLIIYLTYKIKVLETGDHSFFFIAFSILFLFIKDFDFATTSLLFFLMLGFYFLEYTPHKKIAGILLGFALLSKVNSIILIGVLFCFYFYQCYSEAKERKTPVLQAINKAAIPLGCLLLVCVFFVFLYPRFIDFYFSWTQIYPTAYTFQQTIQIVTSMEYIHNSAILFLYFCIFIVLARLFSYKVDVFSCILGVGFVLLFLKSFQTFGNGEIIGIGRYFQPVIPFFLISLYKLKKEFPSFSIIKKITVIFGLFLFFIPLYLFFSGFMLGDISDGSIFNGQKFLDKVRMEISFPLFQLNVEKPIIAGSDYIAMFQKNPFSYLTKTDLIDVNLFVWSEFNALNLELYAPYLVQLGLVKILQPARPFLDVEALDSFLNTTITNNNYSAVIIQLQDEFLPSYLYFYDTILHENTCQVFVPFIIGQYKEGHQPFVFVYLEKTQCSYTTAIASYYQEHFQQLCGRSKIIGETITSVMMNNGIELEEECHSSATTFLYDIPIQIQSMYFCLFVFLFLLIVVLQSWFDR